MVRESDIVHENREFWVCKNRNDYTVYRITGVASYPDSSYEKSPDGLSIAIARCDYLANRLDTVTIDPKHVKADGASWFYIEYGHIPGFLCGPIHDMKHWRIRREVIDHMRFMYEVSARVDGVTLKKVWHDKHGKRVRLEISNERTAQTSQQAAK